MNPLKKPIQYNVWDILPILCLIVLASTSVYVWQKAKETSHNAHNQTFLKMVYESENVLKQRFALYQQSLSGGLGLFNAFDKVTPNEWKSYTDTLKIDRNLPGINGVGYIDYVRAEDLESYLQNQNEAGISNFKNKPDTEFDDKFIIRYSEPISRNQPAIGLDIGFEENRREAAETARDTDAPALTKKIELVQDNKKRNGFLLLLPRYDETQPHNTIEQRQKNILGWIYAPFIADLFLDGIYSYNQGLMKIRVFDSEITSPDELIYEDENYDHDKSTLYRHTTYFDIAGRKWTIEWSNTPEFINQYHSNSNIIVLITGLILTLLLTGLFFLLARINGLSARNLANNQNQLRAIVDNTVDGLIIADKFGVVQKFNTACETIFGYTFDEVVGKNSKLLVPSIVVDHKKTGFVFQTLAVRKNGDIFPIDLSISQIPTNDGIVYSAFIRDITERQMAEKEILRSNEELQNFAYIASHDLQEPLRMVSSFTELLNTEYGEKMDKNASEYMDFIIDASLRMQDMIRDLLDYSRANSDETGFKSFDPETKIDTAILNLDESIKQTNSTIKINKMPETIFCNPIHFTRIIQNLVGNAIKYRQKDIKPHITISAIDDNDQWCFSIQDNGIGMKAEYLDKIFAIFKRLHNKNEYSGTGIGLSICKKLVENMSGQIWVESTPDKGSTFFFTIKKQG